MFTAIRAHRLKKNPASPKQKLLVEALNGHERVFYWSLHGNPEFVSPLP